MHWLMPAGCQGGCPLLARECASDVKSMLSRYCTRLDSPSFWGGEVEILILSKMLRVPIHVMQRAQEAGR